MASPAKLLYDESFCKIIHQAYNHLINIAYSFSRSYLCMKVCTYLKYGLHLLISNIQVLRERLVIVVMDEQGPPSPAHGQPTFHVEARLLVLVQHLLPSYSVLGGSHHAKV